MYCSVSLAIHLPVTDYQLTPMEFSNSTLRVRDARGYSPENHQRLSSSRTRPRPAGVNGIFKFLFLRVRDARGYVLGRFPFDRRDPCPG